MKDWYRNDASPEMSPEWLPKIKEIFLEKDWPIVSNEEDPFGCYYFENFCKLLARLNSEERQLLLFLTEKFLWVRQYEYMKYFAKVFDDFVNKYAFSCKKKVCFCPLLSEADFGKAKSSTALIYMIKVHLAQIKKKHKDIEIRLLESPRLVDINKAINQGFTLCLVDDFIGTGDTVINAMKYFHNNKISRNKMAVISLVCMDEGKRRIEEQGYSIFVNTCCQKGISDLGDSSQVSIMNGLETKIEVPKGFEFGYRRSESLVSMMRTPNNTFPIFWLQNKKNEFAPFPR